MSLTGKKPERLPPASVRSLRYLVTLHGEPRVRAALAELAEQDRTRTRYVRTIESDEIGKSLPFFGRVLPNDVGKRIYLSDGILQYENDEQRDKRRERERAHAGT